MNDEKLINNPKEVKKFGIVLGMILILLAFFQWRKDHLMATYILSSLGFLSELATVTRPSLLKPVLKVFLKIAGVIGWINTRILLIIIFYLLFLPIGLLLKVMGKDLLERKIDKKADTYWVPHKEKPLGKKHYEKQF